MDTDFKNNISRKTCLMFYIHLIVYKMRIFYVFVITYIESSISGPYSSVPAEIAISNASFCSYLRRMRSSLLVIAACCSVLLTLSLSCLLWYSWALGPRDTPISCKNIKRAYVPSLNWHAAIFAANSTIFELRFSKLND